MLVYLPTVACAIALAALVYRYDLYEKEPWYMLALAAVLTIAASYVIAMTVCPAFCARFPAATSRQCPAVT